MTEKEAKEAYLAACRTFREAQRVADAAHQEMLRRYEIWTETDDDD